VAKHLRNDALTTIDLEILGRHLLVGGFIDLVGKAKEKSTRVGSTMLRCSIVEATTPRERLVGDSTTEASGD
jgi:hypothetical protein